jgi:hypothetical protein
VLRVAALVLDLVLGRHRECVIGAESAGKPARWRECA